MQRNRLIAGVVILAVFIILVISGSIVLARERNSRQARVYGREPLPALSYCSSKQVKHCILSFHLGSDGNMVINMLSDTSTPPDFYIKVRHDAEESIYPCQKAERFSTSVMCKGPAMPAGEALQFVIISTDEDIPLAQGDFTIIGFALATPEFFSTPTFSPPPTRLPR